MGLAPGTRLGVYEILSPLGVGGMGEVYKARDVRLARTVAIKVLTSVDPELTARFEREAKAIAALAHPHICTLYDVGQQDEVNYLVMEYLEGGTLAMRIAQGPIPIDGALTISSQIAEALEAAHSIGLVHRDLKPSNVMLTQAGVKLLDFGLATLASGSSETTLARLTTTGRITGTPSYMSPEQARGEQVDPRTDVFSLGAVLYEMVTGRIAFPGESYAVIFSRILGDAPQPAAELNSEVSPELDRIIMKALEKQRDLRYRTAADVRVDLLRLRRDSDPGVIGRARGHASGTSRLGFAHRFGLWTWAAAVALLVISATAMYVLHWRWASDARSPRLMLAVLPFENLSENGRDDYFADGLTEEMIARLGQLQPANLGVIARTSIARYKHTTETAAQIGHELGVQYLLEGSVRRGGDRVRVIAQLVRATEQTQLWSEAYERPLTDVLSIQAEIADNLTRSLSIRLLPAQAASAGQPTLNLASYDKYLLGLHELGKGTREGGMKAIEYFKDAIAVDPANARLHAALGDAYHAVVTYYSSPTEVMPLARKAAADAIALDPNLAAAHVTLGNVHLEFEWDWPAAQREYQRALDINPSLPEAQLGYATYLATLGRFTEAIARVQEAYLVDPLAVHSRNEALWIYYYSGGMQETIDQSVKIIDLEPAAGLPYAMLALASAHLGRGPDVLRAADTAVRLGDSPSVFTTTASALARVGRTAEARQVLTRALDLARERYVCRFLVAAAYVDLGEIEKAFGSLEQAFLQRST